MAAFLQIVGLIAVGVGAFFAAGVAGLAICAGLLLVAAGVNVEVRRGGDA